MSKNNKKDIICYLDYASDKADQIKLTSQKLKKMLTNNKNNIKEIESLYQKMNINIMILNDSVNEYKLKNSIIKLIKRIKKDIK